MHSFVTSLLVAAIATGGIAGTALEAAPSVASGMRQSGAFISVDMTQEGLAETLTVIGGADGPTAIFLAPQEDAANDDIAQEQVPEDTAEEEPVEEEPAVNEAAAENEPEEEKELVLVVEEPEVQETEKTAETQSAEETAPAGDTDDIAVENEKKDVTVHILDSVKEEIPQIIVPCKKGDSGDKVWALQERLRTLGFMADKADGVYGGRTASRVKEVQNFLFGKTGGVAWNPTGDVSQGLADELNSLSFPKYESTVVLGMQNTQVTRVQRRLYVLGYIAQSGIDTVFGKDTQEALTRFQRLNGLEQTGVADEATQNVLFSDRALDAEQERAAHLIEVDLAAQKVYAYGWSNEDQKYSVLERIMDCTTGKEGNETPTGTYRLEERRGEWVYLRMYDGYARYVTVFNGDYFIHSVLYPYKDAPEPMIGANGALTEKISKGSIRMDTDDAQWIYENCRIGTTIEIK